MGYGDLSVDGDFGGNTRQAVIDFQKSNGLIESGKVTDATLEKLNSEEMRAHNTLLVVLWGKLSIMIRR